MASMDRAEILRRYDSDVRTRAESPAPGFDVTWEGPILRMVGPGPEAAANGVLFSRLDASSSDRMIAREIAFFRDKGHAFEWKLFDYDEPRDLADRLHRAGFVPDEAETLVVYDVSSGARFRDAPPGVSLRRLDDPGEYGVIAAVNEAVYGRAQHARWLARTVADEKRAAPDCISVYAAFAGERPVTVGWLRHRPGDAFGSLWGGATLEAWRGKGLYSALVGARVAEAAQRRCRWLTVDCSPMSLPILQRCGFEPLAVTTPYIWSPPG
jgi:GNAT superfamily N-acetyltransferase